MLARVVWEGLDELIINTATTTGHLQMGIWRLREVK